ncbi:GxxExxY protein [Pinibacter soli]|uniref:GxxExxY protein n=1 Tax=Pinibacter soli TaxID=3044211 RepID=A0ABT6RCE7_9BACT|nr:GxxExxY protein [Pinibacter soli]MDI3320146.1 GxxExxY protein [Pinibacter soli]
MITQKYINDVSYAIVSCAIEVHNHLGPGLLESVYKTCMIEELRRVDFNVKTEVWVPIRYKEKVLESSLKLDLLINDIVIVELKATEAIIPVYKAQLLSYLRLANKPKGLLINFHCDNITKQLVPLVTKEFAELPKY